MIYKLISKKTDQPIYANDLENITYFPLTSSYDTSLMTSLAGIEHLTNLDILYINWAVALTSVDVSKCSTLTKLYIEDCHNVASVNTTGLENLERLEIYVDDLGDDPARHTALTSLDLSTNTGLKYLYIADCVNLTSLNLKQNTNLETLWLEDYLGVTSLDLSGNTQLAELTVEECPKLESLTLNSKVLTKVYVTETQVASLDVSGCEDLSRLWCEWNASDFAVNITGCDSLINLDIGGSYEFLKAMNDALEDLAGKLSPEEQENLSEMDLFGWDDGWIISFKDYTYALPDCNVSITGLDDCADSLEQLNLYSNIYDSPTPDFSALVNLKGLGCGFTDITSVTLPKNLERLWLPFNHLTYVDLSDYSNTEFEDGYLMLGYQKVPVTLTNDGKGTYSTSIRIGELTDDPPVDAMYTPGEGGAEGTLTITDTSIKELKFSTPTGLQNAETPSLVTGKLLLTYEGENNPPDDGNDPPADNTNTGDNNTSDDEKPRPSAPSGGGGGSSSGGGGGSTEPSPSPSASPEAPETGVDSELTNPYIDVFESDWFYADVLTVTFAGLMKGKNTTRTYCPSDDLTRAEWVMILARMSNAPAANVISDPWYQAAWDWGIAEGITDGTNPIASITREQLVTILWRYAGEPDAYVGGGVPDAPQSRNLSGVPDAPQSRNLSGYADSAQISDWARDAVAWAVGRGILQGDANGLRPGDNVKRSEVAAILRRYLEG
ncbi:MAG: S-layer homology domain-containing protein [Oscillospiraceae bacterium]|jgi:hypothetical protein|nr:S-layer homology domain-containing protein [Oscillospiraceae bacterium]